ncbi:MAG: hypothetical protein U5L00_07845 [Desulfovermiculus sp.]|nr:hypothetical protein [Desulfovermiculus sp.]
MAELARRHTGLKVIEADFETFDFQGMDMDALLLVGLWSMCHMSVFSSYFHDILRAIEPQGHVLLTVKQGQGVRNQTLMDGSLPVAKSRSYAHF